MPLIIAFTAGVLSFFSPCVFPLIPAYLSLITGVTIEDFTKPDRSWLGDTIVDTLLFILGFSIIFTLFGATATFVGQLLIFYYGILEKVAGILVIIFGLYILGVFKIGFLDIERRIHLKSKPTGLFGSLILGMAFAIGWTPCIGPILGSILVYAATTQTLYQGMLMLFVYSLGFGLPFLIVGLTVNTVLKFIPHIARHLRLVTRISGILLVILGILLFTGYFRWLEGFLVLPRPF